MRVFLIFSSIRLVEYYIQIVQLQFARSDDRPTILHLHNSRPQIEHIYYHDLPYQELQFTHALSNAASFSVPPPSPSSRRVV